jgi:CDGSH-type Zn-finger protein
MDECRITPYEDGPLLVRGPFELVDQDGNEIDVRRKTIALCRCGKSKIRPFCDGTHNAIKFKAEGGPEGMRATRADGEP